MNAYTHLTHDELLRLAHAEPERHDALQRRVVVEQLEPRIAVAVAPAVQQFAVAE